jgi:hypothetical protein
LISIKTTFFFASPLTKENRLSRTRRWPAINRFYNAADQFGHYIYSETKKFNTIILYFSLCLETRLITQLKIAAACEKEKSGFLAQFSRRSNFGFHE